jgi:hypothetical protein
MSDYTTRYTIEAPGGMQLWVESDGVTVWLGLTDDDETVQSYWAAPVADLRRTSDALAAVVARLET